MSQFSFSGSDSPSILTVITLNPCAPLATDAKTSQLFFHIGVLRKNSSKIHSRSLMQKERETYIQDKSSLVLRTFPPSAPPTPYIPLQILPSYYRVSLKHLYIGKQHLQNKQEEPQERPHLIFQFSQNKRQASFFSFFFFF